jgi:hypothetical protein
MNLIILFRVYVVNSASEELLHSQSVIAAMRRQKADIHFRHLNNRAVLFVTTEESEDPGSRQYQGILE